MGAYWAGKDYFNILDRVDAVQYLKQPNTDTRRPHAKNINIEWLGESMNMFWYDGCAFTGPGYYDTIAKYANDDPMAIIQNNIASDDALYVYPDGRLGFWPCSVSSLTVPTGQWTYVAVSYNGTNLIYCVNGTIQTITATCTDITDWDFLRIGAHGVSDGERWIGKIAVSKVYDRALTAQEMQQNYQQYKTRFNLS